MSILGGIIGAFNGSGNTIIVVPATSAAVYEPYYLLSQIKTVDGSGSGLDADLLDGYHASYFGTAAQVINLQNTDVSLQSQINNLFAIGSRLVFRENFTGNGSSTGCVLTGALQNAGFAVGSWSAANILVGLQVDITDLDGKPIYDSNVPIYRDRIAVTSIDSFGNVSFNFAPQAGQQYAIWYWYQLQASNVLSYYYREDHVASMEGDGVQMATQVDTDTTAYGNIVLRSFDNTVQKSLNRLDTVVQSLALISSNSVDLSQYTLLSTTASISGSLNVRLTAVENSYATKNATVAGTYNTVSVNGQGIVTSGSNVGYVLKTGDTMTGSLTITTTGSQSLKINSDADDGNAIVINSDSSKSGVSSVVFSRDGIPGVTLIAGTDLTNYAAFNVVDNSTFVGNIILDYTVSDGSAVINANQPQLTTQSNLLIGSDYPELTNNTGNVFIGKNGNIAITRAMNNNVYNYTLTSNTSGGLQLAANNNIYYFNNNGVFDAPNVRVRGVSGLNNAIVTHDANGNLLNSGYTVSSITGGLVTSSTLAAISGSLNVRLTTVENNYATKNATVAGTYNTLTVNGQGIVISGSNADYATNAMVASVSGSLQSQITSISGNYVKKSGDVMSGILTMDVSGGIGLPPLLGSERIIIAAADGDFNRIKTMSFGAASSLSMLNINYGGTRSNPSATQSDAQFFTMTGWGHDGTALRGSQVSYTIRALNTWSSTDRSTYHRWEGTKSSSTSNSLWMRLQDSNLAILGTLTLGTTTPTSAQAMFIPTGGDNIKGVIVRANSATQSASLEEWQDSSGNALVAISGNGGVGINSPNGITIQSLAGLNNSIVLHDSNGKLIDSGVLIDSIPTNSTLATISGGLNTRILNIENNYVSNITSVSGSVIVTNNGHLFNVEVATAPIQTHNNLNGLQGGTAGQYYHLTASQYNDYIGQSTVATISGNLQSQITSISASLGGYATIATVASISGGLNTRLTTVENNYATKSSITAGTYNNITVNGQGIAVSGSNVSYTTDATVQTVSGSLNTRLVAIENNYVSQITSVSGSVLISHNGSQYNIEVATAPIQNHNSLSGLQGGTTNEYYHLTASQSADFIGRTEVRSISGGLNTRLTAVENSYATNATVQIVSGSLQSQINTHTSQINNLAAITGSYAIDSHVVHISGTETIFGSKTFNTQVSINSGGLFLNNSGTSSISAAGSELVLSQFGDSLGSSILRLRNRTASNGIAVENPTLDLVDISFIPSSKNQGNIRFERRSSSILDTANISGEYQFIYLNQLNQSNICATIGSTGIWSRTTNSATSTSNIPSPYFRLSGNIWNGSSAISDSWTLSNTYGSGANPTSTLNINQAGSTGTAILGSNGILSVGSNTSGLQGHQIIHGGGGSGSAAYNCLVVGPTTLAPAGNIYGIGINKNGIEALMMGVNKNTATNNVPGNYCYITTYTLSSGLSIGRGNGLGSMSTSDISIRGSDGFIGINTTAPTRLFTVNGDTSTTNAFITSLPNALSGNFLTWDNNDKLIDSGMSTTTISSISGNLQTQINSINVVGGSGISVVQSPSKTWTISLNGGLQGRLSLNTGSSTYTVNHAQIDSTQFYPVVSLDIPTSASDIFVQGIYNRTNTSFNVVLSHVPSLTGYGLLWHIATALSGSSQGFTPFAGTGMTITPSGSNYTFAVNDYIGASSALTKANNLSDVASANTARNNINRGLVNLGTQAGNIATDCSLGNCFTVTMSGSSTLTNPTNMAAGATYNWIVKQDATGGRTLAFGTAFKFPSAFGPVATSGSNSVDIYSGLSDGSVMYMGAMFDMR